MARKGRKTLGEAMREIRLARRAKVGGRKHATLEAVGRALGVDGSMISHMEAGRCNVRVDQLSAFASHFGMTIAEVLHGVSLEKRA